MKVYFNYKVYEGIKNKSLTVIKEYEATRKNLVF